MVFARGYEGNFQALQVRYVRAVCHCDGFDRSAGYAGGVGGAGHATLYR